MLTPSMEDYLEKIYELMKDKGYARVSDIASSLAVQPSSVTKMLQKLDEQHYVTYEKYRGILLTKTGERMGRSMKQRHGMLEELLRMLGISEEVLRGDVEGIEHHVSPQTVTQLQNLVSWFQTHPQYIEAFTKYRSDENGEQPHQTEDGNRAT
ncbi:transcriptional regulator MntR [Ferroacidibacillus organovorans]|uniref:Manganese transport regulator n=1 Tax=Ferroacidibacillus organovorans TaxID=1765683 RepID=A0A162RYP9_9BACL|nr:transcriptional regulator MntR [Ferroacidibacillus organovorans]KYP79371.1 transcriptional regulator [Ferroacidibacillus organovorans]OAG89952.1 transcriptional regulator [Ferroacidibacillus organovorans]OPG17447.1 transcriptional regulator [Ferroacidibacillus organovorans]